MNNNNDTKVDYSPAPVEVFHTSTTVGIEQIVGTFRAMLSHTLTTLLQMLSHPDRQLIFKLDPGHKHAFCNIAVLLEETASQEQIEVARNSVLAAYDHFIEQERPKFARVAIPEASQNGNAKPLIV